MYEHNLPVVLQTCNLVMELSIYLLYNTIVDKSTNRFFHVEHFTINISRTSRWWRKFWLLSSDNVNHWLELCHQGHYFSIKYEPITLRTPNRHSTMTFMDVLFFRECLWRFYVPECVSCFCSQIRWNETELNEWIVFSFQNRL